MPKKRSAVDIEVSHSEQHTSYANSLLHQLARRPGPATQFDYLRMGEKRSHVASHTHDTDKSWANSVMEEGQLGSKSVNFKKNYT